MQPGDDALLKLCYSPGEAPTRHLSGALGLPYVDPSALFISCGILRRMPAELCCRLRCVPFVFNRTRAVLLVDDPFQAAYLAANIELLGPDRPSSIEYAMTTPSGLDGALHRRLTLVRERSSARG